MSEYLYRFRRLSSPALSEIYYGAISGSTADTFNDPFDLTIASEPRELIKKTTLSNEENQLRYYRCIYPKREFYNDFNCEDPALFGYELFGLLDSCKREIQKRYLIASFSETLFSEPMWAHYSDNSSGFVLAYEKKALLEKANLMVKELGKQMPFELLDNMQLEKSFGLKKIEYEGEMPSYTDEMARLFNAYIKNIVDEKDYCNSYLSLFIDFDISQKVLCQKHDSWSYEKEWRLILPNVYDPCEQFPSHKLFCKLKPKQIIFGIKMPSETKKLITDIAKLNGDIEIKEMAFAFDKINSKLKINDYRGDYV